MTAILNSARPFIQATALLFALLAAIKGIQELIPALNIITIRGTTQTYAILGGCLALAAGGR
jgi:hypothetical protein